MFLYIWLGVALLGILGLIFHAGQSGESEDWDFIPLFIGWPAVLIVLAIMAPFYGVYHLGKLFRRKQ